MARGGWAGAVLLATLGLGWAQPAPAPAGPVPAGTAPGTAAAETGNTAIRPVPREEPAWGRANTQLNALAAAGGFDVMWLGDSITQHWAVEGKETWDAEFAPFKSANFGIGGDRTEHVLWRLQHGHLVPQVQPKVCMLLIGTNNIGVNSTDEIAAGVAAIVKLLREQRPSMDIVLLGLLPRSERGSAHRAQAAQVNTLLAKLDDGVWVHYADVGAPFVDVRGDLRTDRMPDLLHPNAAGYRLLGDGLRFPLHRVYYRPWEPLPRLDKLWLTRQQQLSARAQAGGVEIAWLGDSLVHGWEGAGRAAWRESLAPLKCANFGMEGDLTQHVLWRLLNGNLAEPLQPKLFVLQVGADNVVRDGPVKAAAGASAIVKLLRERRPTAQVLVQGLLPLGREARAEQRLAGAAYNDLLAKLDDGRFVHFASEPTAFLERDGRLPFDLSHDACHLTADGYARWAEVTLAQFAQLARPAGVVPAPAKP